MPGSRQSRRGAGRGSNSAGNGSGGGFSVGVAPAGAPGTTGRYLVLMREGAFDAGVQTLTEGAGMRVTSAAEFDSNAVPADAMASAEAIMFPSLGVAVVNAPPDQFQVLGAAAAEDGAILAIEEERIVYAIDEDVIVDPGIPVTLPVSMPLASAGVANSAIADYLRGYRDAVNHLADTLLGDHLIAEALAQVGTEEAETGLTWGLQATNVAASPFTGAGVRVAVLDTGMDLQHPDFVGRKITSQSFINNQAVQDGHGHGTHCIGTSCGPRQPGQLPRYGIAYEAEIYVGKVLSNQGSGSDGGILAGIEWAINNQCAVISMSLGAPVSPGQSFSRIFETVAKRALAQGTLIIAAAGNESSRPAKISPVGHPANCPSIIAVAAIDSNLNIAYFSCGGLSRQGGQVDIAGPGVAVRSSWPRPTLYRTISGTSMATPHVAGIAALHAQANPDMRGGALGWLLLQSSKRLELPTRDVGVGLIQAPV